MFLEHAINASSTCDEVLAYSAANEAKQNADIAAENANNAAASVNEAKQNANTAAINANNFRYHALSAPLFHTTIIKKVIFNGPATIVIWEDGTKTIVKCSANDRYDPEKGLAMAMLKHLLGEKEFKKVFRTWVMKRTDMSENGQ